MKAGLSHGFTALPLLGSPVARSAAWTEEMGNICEHSGRRIPKQ